jgi:hypothetical protein
MDKFNLTKFLTENRLTRLGRLSERSNSTPIQMRLSQLTYEKLKDYFPDASHVTVPNNAMSSLQIVFADRERIKAKPEHFEQVDRQYRQHFEDWKQKKMKKWGDMEIQVNIGDAWNAVKILDEPYNTALRDEQLGIGAFMAKHKMSLDESDDQQLDASSAAVVKPSEEQSKAVVDFSKYSSVEELMKEIEVSTNEAAHKHKMERVKEAFEALEARAASLEEGEHAAYIAPTKIKEMKTSAKKLRKMHESLAKLYEKKYAKKTAKKQDAEGMM